MDFWKFASSICKVPLNSCSDNAREMVQHEEQKTTDVDVDLREVYFLILQFLSCGPCQKTFGQFWNELLEHELLERRHHAWFSRSGEHSGVENDDGVSLPLSYNKLVDRYIFFIGSPELMIVNFHWKIVEQICYLWQLISHIGGLSSHKL